MKWLLMGLSLLPTLSFSMTRPVYVEFEPSGKIYLCDDQMERIDNDHLVNFWLGPFYALRQSRGAIKFPANFDSIYAKLTYRSEKHAHKKAERIYLIAKVIAEKEQLLVDCDECINEGYPLSCLPDPHQRSSPQELPQIPALQLPTVILVDPRTGFGFSGTKEEFDKFMQQQLAALNSYRKQ